VRAGISRLSLGGSSWADLHSAAAEWHFPFIFSLESFSFHLQMDDSIKEK
jgi:hypothetical protein